MSLVASALRMDLDVGMYLESVLTHMLRGTAKTEELFPDRWTAAHLPGGASVPRARATRQGRYGRCESSRASGTCGAPQRQMGRQKGRVRRAVPMGLLGSADRAPYWPTCVCGVSLPPQFQPRGATSRSIHLEPSTGLGHFCKPELQ
jgi:hypothetical protein